eukprot:275915-Alexandrium_andersonii.AAC.1
MCIRDSSKENGYETGVVRFDCVKCYEQVPLEAAAIRIKQSGFPLRILKLVLLLYAAPRAVVLENAVGPWVHAG